MSGQTSESGEITVSVYMLLCVQSGCNGISVSGIYLYAIFTGKRAGRYGIYVAADSDRDSGLSL